MSDQDPKQPTRVGYDDAKAIAAKVARRAGTAASQVNRGWLKPAASDAAGIVRTGYDSRLARKTRSGAKKGLTILLLTGITGIEIFFFSIFLAILGGFSTGTVGFWFLHLIAAIGGAIWLYLRITRKRGTENQLPPPPNGGYLKP